MNVKKRTTQAERIVHAVLALILLFGSMLNAAPVGAGSTSTDWSTVSSLPTGNTLSGAVYGNGIYVAVGSGGAILASANGTDSWVSHDTGTADLNGIACGVDGSGSVLFAAVGSDGTILTSADGTTWDTAANPVPAANLKGITYGGGQFVAVGDNGTILASADGGIWTAQNSGTENSLYSVACGSNYYVAVGQNGMILYYALDSAAGAATITSVRDNQSSGDYGVILTSTDGVNWSTQGDGSTTWSRLYGVAYGNGIFVAVGYNGIILTSSDGITWDIQPASGSSTSDTLNGISYVNDAFVAVGYGGRIIYSTDGVAWYTSTDSRTSVNLYGVAYNNGLYVAVGESGTVRISNNLPPFSDSEWWDWAWRGCDSGTKNVLYATSYGNGVYVAVGADGTILTTGTANTAVLTTVNAANNSVSVNPASITVGSSTTIIAAGDRQSVAGEVYGDERYIPTTWTSSETGKNGTFTLSGGNYTSGYTPSSAGNHTVTATFRKQTWDGSVWNDAADPADTKAASLTVSSTSGGSGGNGGGEGGDIDISPTISGVSRLAGPTRVDTALAIAKAEYPGQVANVVLATADDYPDALAGSVLAYKLNAPILLVGSPDADQEKVLDYMKANLDPAGTVYILGGAAVVSSTMESKVVAGGFNNITRIAGADRYETSAKIAEQLGTGTGTPVVLVSGENYPDALSISSVAAQMQFPIFLVQKDGISNSVRQEIAAIKPSKVYIIGGEGVISTTEETQVARLTGLAQANIVRIGGADRYATSLAVARYFDLSGQNVCIATGDNFSDALAGSVYAANHNVPIILADGKLPKQAIDYFKTEKLSRATIFGGESAVSQEVERQLEELIEQTIDSQPDS